MSVQNVQAAARANAAMADIARAKLEEFRSRLAEIRAASGSGSAEPGANTAVAKLLSLFDPGSFAETGAFVSQRPIEGAAVCGGAESVITGYGAVDGGLVFAFAQDSSVLRGSVSEMSAKKITGIIQMAVKMGAPLVAVFDSSGARLSEGVDALFGYASIIRELNTASGVIPLIAVVLGSCHGALAAAAAACDFIILNQDAGFSVGTPEVIRALNPASPLPGAKSEFAWKSGSADIVCADGGACFAAARSLLALIPPNNLDAAAVVTRDDAQRDTGEFYGADGNIEDYRAFVADLTDTDSFIELKAGFAGECVTGIGRFNGVPAGVVAGNPAYNTKTAAKAAKLIVFCDAFNIPVVTVADARGLELSASNESENFAGAVAELTAAYSSATTALVTIVSRAYGAAGIAAGSRGLGADIVYAWPFSEISIADPLTAANILFYDRVAASADPVLERESVLAEYRETLASPYESAKRGYIDAIIEPRDTRRMLIAAIEMTYSKKAGSPARKHSGFGV